MAARSFISYDDAYSPPKAVEQSHSPRRKRPGAGPVQSHGHGLNLAIQKYMNGMKVPQISSPRVRSPSAIRSVYPWTMGC